MQDKFPKILKFTLISLVLCAALLFILNLNSKPRVISSQFEPSSSVNNNKQQVVINFNRPMDTKSVSANLSINPSADFDTVWIGNQLTIIFKDHLKYDTDYKISLSSNIKDAYGINLVAGYDYSFKVPIAKFAYLQRDDEDHTKQAIVLTDINMQHTKTLFSGQFISTFGLNEDYLAFAETNTDGSSSLHLQNIATSEDKTISLGIVKINQIYFSPVADQFAYLYQNITFKEGYVVPQGVSKIGVYDIQSQTMKDLDVPSDIQDIMNFQYTPDGQGIVYQATDNTFYVYSLNSNKNEVNLGKHLEFRGFNKQLTKALFINSALLTPNVNYQSTVIVDQQRNSTTILDGFNDDIDATFFNATDDILYSEQLQPLEGARGLYGVIHLDSNSDQTLLVSSDKYSYELPRVSPDDQYVLIEQYNFNDLLTYTNLRNVGSHAKPYNANLVIYDLATQELLPQTVRGVNAIWIK